MTIDSRSGIPFRSVVLTMGAIILGLCIAAVVIFQARYLIIGPQITLTNEPTGPQNERQIALTGNARNISRLWLNDRPIFTDLDGNFSEAVVLSDGLSLLTLRATDRYGRTTIVEKPLVYSPASFF